MNRSVFAYFLLILYVWSYGHAMGTHNAVFELQNHQHFHDGQKDSQKHPEGHHMHYNHDDHIDHGVMQLIFCALTEYGHFLWDIEHGEHGIHFSLGLNSNDLLKELADGSGPVPIHPIIEEFLLELQPKLVEEKENKKCILYRQDLYPIDLIIQSPLRGPPSISC